MGKGYRAHSRHKTPQNPPPKKAVLFVGSSSIRLWKLEGVISRLGDDQPRLRRFQKWPTPCAMQKRIVIPHQPRTVVLYAGDNDIAGGKIARAGVRRLSAVRRRSCTALPKTKIIYIGIKPSIKRWTLIDKIREANRLIREHIARRNEDRLDSLISRSRCLGPMADPRLTYCKRTVCTSTKRVMRCGRSCCVT